MSIPLERFFRILVVGEHTGVVAQVIEDELHFPVTSIDLEQIPQAIRGGADLGAIIVAREGDGTVRRGERFDQSMLKRTQILRFVDEECAEARA